MAVLPTQARFDGPVIENVDLNITYLYAGRTTYSDKGAYAKCAIHHGSYMTKTPELFAIVQA